MAGNIKGITIEFRGDTTRLDKALRDVNKSTKDIDKELRQVDKALKFNPTSVELWRQKQDLLKAKISETKDKLDVLKQAQAKMDADGVDKNSEEYRKLQREIIVTENQLKNYEGQLKKVGNVNLRATSEQFKQLGNNLTQAGEAMKGLSTAGAAVAASIGALAVKSGQWADDLNTMSKVYGISTIDLQKYKAAADLVDVSVEDIAKSHLKLEKTMYSAANGSKSQAEAFDKLGVSVTNSDGSLKSSDQVFQEVITSLGNMTNETERDALAQKILGKSAANLNPLIEDQGETYKNVADTFAKYNLDFVDQETLDKANQFNDKLDEMKMVGQTSLSIVGAKLAELLLPAMEKVAEWMGKLAEKISNMNPTVLTVIGIIGGVLAVIAPLLLIFGKIAFAISSIMGLMSTLGVSFAAIAGPVGIAIAAIAAIIAIGVLLYKNWDKIKAVAKAVGEKIKTIWTSIKTSITNTIKSIKTKVSDGWESIKTKTANAWNTIKDKVTAPFKKAKETISNIIQKIKDFFPIKLGKLFKGIKLPHFDVEWSTITAFGHSVDFPSGFDIEWYKKGGIFDSPSLIGVGEAGAEAVVPLDKFWDKLDNMQGGSITINVYPSQGMNETELAKKVEQRLVQLQKQRNMAYGNI